MGERPWASAFSGHPPQGQHSLEITVHQQNSLLFYKHPCRQFMRYFHFSLPPRRSKTLWLRIKTYGKNLQNISWHAISYHSHGEEGRVCQRRKACQSTTIRVYIRTNMNHVCVSRNSLSWAQHLNELHARRTVVFHMAERPTDTLSRIHLAVMALASRPRFNGSHVLIGDSPQTLLPVQFGGRSIVYLRLSGHRCLLSVI